MDGGQYAAEMLEKELNRSSISSSMASSPDVEKCRPSITVASPVLSHEASLCWYERLLDVEKIATLTPARTYRAVAYIH